MRESVLVLLALGTVTFALKAAGPLVLGNRELSPRTQRLVALVPAPLLAALVVVATAAVGDRLVLDARAAGLVAAGVVLARGGGFLPTVLVAAAVTALVRAVVGT